MSKLLALVCALWTLEAIASLKGIAYYPLSFQKNYEKLSDTELKSQLYAILDGIHVVNPNGADEIVKNCPEAMKCYSQARNISYKRAREILFGELHLITKNRQTYVQDVYCHNRATAKDGVGVGKIPNAKVQNCEHTWPQSKFNRSEDMALQKTDLHHLFPVDSRANSSRSNNPFGEVKGVDVHENCAASQKGVILGTNTKGFEPPDSHKGNVARALFYFSVRYKSSLPQEYQERLKHWNSLDPVDEFERERNETIYEVQGTRNPFIDDPDLADLINDF